IRDRNVTGVQTCALPILRGSSKQKTQQRAFEDQLDLAVQMKLPLFLHVRSSCSDFIEIIKPYLPKLPRGGLVHSFAGSKDEMLRSEERRVGKECRFMVLA